MLIQQEDIQLLLMHHYIVAKSLVAQLGHSWCFQMRRLGFKSSLPRREKKITSLRCDAWQDLMENLGKTIEHKIKDSP